MSPQAYAPPTRRRAPTPAVKTDRAIGALRPRTDPYDVKVDGAPGLYLRVTPRGDRVFRLLVKRYDSSAGRRATAVTTLGRHPDGISLADARRAAWAASKRSSGPVERSSVADALGKFFSAHEHGAHAWRPATFRNYGAYRAALAQAIGTRPLADVGRHELAALLRAYAKRGPVAANRLASFASSFWSWCVGEGLTDNNIVDKLGDKQKLPGGEEASRERVLTDDEIRDLWHSTGPHANLLRALVLTGCRIAELQRARVEHVNGDWLTIPAEHAKNGRAHQVYVVPELKPDGRPPLLFRSVSPTAVQAWVKRSQAELADPYTPHDLRRTFATLAARAGILEHVIVRLLNQTPSDTKLSRTLGTYQRHEYLEERRAATLAVRDLILELSR